jgi:hypothetical protein
MRRVGRMGLALLLLVGVALAMVCMTAEAQVTPGGYAPLCTAQSLTNGSTTTIGASTNVPAGAESIQLMAIVEPQGTTVATKQNFCTNLVLTFQYQIGTNTTTDTPFTWTIATDQFGALSTSFTNPVVVWTNLTSKRGLTGLKLATALPNSTNTAGPKLTLLVGRSP